MEPKPKKIVFDAVTQKKIFGKIKEKLEEIFNSDRRIKEIRIFGSAATMQLGAYAKTFKSKTPLARDASDIDVVFLVDKIRGDEITLDSGHKLKADFLLGTKKAKKS